MIKKFKIILIISLIIMSSGCFKRDNMEDINIITTVYPLEYVIDKLYGDKAVVNSIYPDGVNIEDYEMTKKQINDYSKKNLFVYNGLTSDKDIALTLLNKNKNISIIDANYGMETQYDIEELWLNPSNLLMISQNIKNSLYELINSKYIKDEIEKSYSDLKVELSELDANIKLLVENAENKTIITGSKSLLFLTKYGLNVIYVADQPEYEKNVIAAEELFNSEKIDYIFMIDNEKESKILQKFKKEYEIEIISLNKLDNITDEERDNEENYITIMNKNLELLKKGL